jgi:hypothetical protein
LRTATDVDKRGGLSWDAELGVPCPEIQCENETHTAFTAAYPIERAMAEIKVNVTRRSIGPSSRTFEEYDGGNQLRGYFSGSVDEWISTGLGTSAAILGIFLG